MIACLPRANSPVYLYIDVDALRRSGILELIAGSRATEELEYRQFVADTRFDYRRDLDRVAASFARDEIYLVLQGRFDWKALIKYARGRGGRCRFSFCDMPSSRPDRSISFFPLSTSTLAMAVSADLNAASAVSMPRPPVATPVPPPQPVWVSFPSTALRNRQDLPAGARNFVAALAAAEKVNFSIGPHDDRLDLQMDAICSSAEIATTIANQLEGLTDVFRKLLARESATPNPRDLSGLLAGGMFRHEDRRVYGSWPMQRAFLEALAGGSVN